MKAWTPRKSDELSAHLERIPAETMTFEEWAWAFPRFGQDIATWAALTAARLALPVFEGHRGRSKDEQALFADMLPRHAVTAIDRWLHDGRLARADLEIVARDLEELWATIDVFVDEASGSAKVVEARRQALSALAAVRGATKCATWTPELVTHAIHDPVEAKAQIEAGPAQHVVEAFAHACNALQIDANALRKKLKALLLD